jgi:hypothetical protein
MRIDITVPTKWNELTPFQLKLIGRLLYSKKEFEKKFFRQLLATVIFIPKFRFIHFWKFFLILREVGFDGIIQYADFIFDENDALTKFPEFYKVGRTKLYGPGERLQNISINELSYADAFYFNWINKSDEKDLQRLVACLYRPAGTNNQESDIRKPFNKLLLPKNAELTDRIALSDMYIIALAYQGSRETFKKRYPYVFPKPLKSEEEETIKPNKPIKYTPFSKLVNAMAMDEVQVFGTISETENANAMQFLELYNETLLRESKKR